MSALLWGKAVSEPHGIGGSGVQRDPIQVQRPSGRETWITIPPSRGPLPGDEGTSTLRRSRSWAAAGIDPIPLPWEKLLHSVRTSEAIGCRSLRSRRDRLGGSQASVENGSTGRLVNRDAITNDNIDKSPAAALRPTS